MVNFVFLSALTSLNVSNAVLTLVAVATVFVGLLAATAVIRPLSLVTLISLVFTPMLTVLLFVASKVVDTFT